MTTAQSSIPLTEDGYVYATFEPGDIETDKKPNETEYILPLDKNPGYDEVDEDENPGYDEVDEDKNPGYDEVNDDQDPVKARYEVSPELAQETARGNNKNYGTYWEPANKEEELMSQLYSTLKLQRIPSESIK